MWRSRLSLARAAALALLVGATLGSCSSDRDATPERPTPTALTADDVSCDRDRTSPDAKTTIEQVGGLASDDFVVRFSQSTRLGVVALVDGDIQKAFDELVTTYGVAVVAQLEDDDTSKVTGFQQVRDLVASICD